MPLSSRLSVVEQVYHQVPGGKSTAVVSRFAIDSQAAPSPVYEVTFPLPETWTALPGVLPAKVVMLVVQLSKPVRKEMPSHEERAAEVFRHVLIGFAPKPVVEKDRTQHSPPVVPFTCRPVIEVGNGESCRFRPVDASQVWVRATCPGVVVTVSAIPG